MWFFIAEFQVRPVYHAEVFKFKNAINKLVYHQVFLVYSCKLCVSNFVGFIFKNYYKGEEIIRKFLGIV